MPLKDYSSIDPLVFADTGKRIGSETTVYFEGKKKIVFREAKKIEVISYSGFKRRKPVFADTGEYVDPLRIISEGEKRFCIRDGEKVEVISKNAFKHRRLVYIDTRQKINHNVPVFYENKKTYTMRRGEKVEVISYTSFYYHNRKGMEDLSETKNPEGVNDNETGTPSKVKEANAKNLVFADSGKKINADLPIIDEKNKLYVMRGDDRIEAISLQLFRYRHQTAIRKKLPQVS